MKEDIIIVLSLLTLIVAGIGVVVGGWTLYHDYQSDKDSAKMYQNISDDLKGMKEDLNLLVPDKPQITFNIHGTQRNESYNSINFNYLSDSCFYTDVWNVKPDKETEKYDVLRVYIKNDGKKTYDLNSDIYCYNSNTRTREDYLSGFLMAICPEENILVNQLSFNPILSISEIDRTTEYLVVFIYESISANRTCDIKYEAKDISGEIKNITPYY